MDSCCILHTLLPHGCVSMCICANVVSNDKNKSPNSKNARHHQHRTELHRHIGFPAEQTTIKGLLCNMQIRPKLITAQHSPSRPARKNCVPFGWPFGSHLSVVNGLAIHFHLPTLGASTLLPGATAGTAGCVFSLFGVSCAVIHLGSVEGSRRTQTAALNWT